MQFPKIFGLSLVCMMGLTLNHVSGAIISAGFGPMSGIGPGGQLTVLTQKSPANTTSSTGCSFWNGASSVTGSVGCPVALGGDELAQNSTFTVGELALTNFNQLRIIYNASEPGAGENNSVTLTDLVLLLTAPDGTHVSDFTALRIVAPINIPDISNGSGTGGFFYVLDGAGVTAAQSFWSTHGLTADLRIGLAARLDNGTGGNQTFFLQNSEIPEPLSAGLLGTGLVILAALSARRRRHC
jgi:hypothetical protein